MLIELQVHCDAFILNNVYGFYGKQIMTGAIALKVLRFSPFTFIPLMRHTHSFIHSFIHQRRLITVADVIT